MTSASEAYKERLKQRGRQEYEDKGKTGLGRKSVLDYSRAAGRPVNFWIPRYHPEVNPMDIIPFVITQDWYRKLRMPSGRPNGLEAGMWDYKLQIPVHRGVGANKDVYLCLREAFGGACIICDEMFEAYKTGDKKLAADLRPGWRCFYNVYDYDDPDKGIMLFEISYYCFEATTKLDPQRASLIDAMMLDPSGPVPFCDLQEGSTIVAKFKKKVLGKVDFPEISEIKFEARDPYDESILQKVYPLDSMLVIPTPEEVRKAYFELEETPDEIPEGETSKEEAPKEEQSTETKTTRSRTRTASTSAGETDSKPQEETSGITTSSRRARAASPQEPSLEKPKDTKPENPPWEEGQCPAGKTFGKDFNTGADCEGKSEKSCDEETFDKCSNAFQAFQSKKTEEPPVQTGSEDAPQTTSRRARR